jgi:hypothetical protein
MSQSNLGVPLATFPTAGSRQNAVSPPSLASSRQSQDGHNEKKPGGRRRKQGRDSLMHNDEKEAPLNEMGRLYEKILTYSTGTRYSIYILPVAIILMVPVIVGATQVSSNPKKDPKIGGIRVVWFFAWIESVWLTFWGMKFVARVLPGIFGYFAGVVSSETKKYARALENLHNMVAILGWVIISFVLYEVLFSTSAAGNAPLGWTKQFKQVMAAILVSTIIFTIEKVFVQLISINYHARSFNNRIETTKRNVYLLSLLFDASRALFPMYGNDFFEEDHIIHSNIETFVRKGFASPGNYESSPHQHHKTIFKGIGRLSSKMNSVFGNIAAELTGKSVLPPKSAQTIVIEALGKTKSAKALAQRLWLSFVMEGNSSLHLSDLQEVLGGNTSSEIAEECFHMLDPDENEDVSLEEMVLKLTELSLERKAIARSMHDVSQAIKALDGVLSSVALLISFFVLGKWLIFEKSSAELTGP